MNKHPRAGARRAAARPIRSQIISKDSQSSGTRASEVAAELILRDKVDLIVASSAPDTTNPVADQAEVNEVPCVTTNCPWQPYFFGRNGDPEEGLHLDLSFLLGPRGRHRRVSCAMWDGAPTNKVIGGLFPNDADGNAWGDPQARPAASAHQGRLQAHRSRPLPGDEQRLHLADFGVQERRRRDRRRQHDPAGLRDLLVAGGAAELPSQDRDHRQGAAVSFGGRLARPARQRPDHRNLVDADIIRSSPA